jgi:hypothetical protein
MTGPNRILAASTHGLMITHDVITLSVASECRPVVPKRLRGRSQGPEIRPKRGSWGDQFGPVHDAGTVPACVGNGPRTALEVASWFRERELLGLPWELISDGTGPVALGSRVRFWERDGSSGPPPGAVRRCHRLSPHAH